MRPSILALLRALFTPGLPEKKMSLLTVSRLIFTSAGRTGRVNADWSLWVLRLRHDQRPRSYDLTDRSKSDYRQRCF